MICKKILTFQKSRHFLLSFSHSYTLTLPLFILCVHSLLSLIIVILLYSPSINALLGVFLCPTRPEFDSSLNNTCSLSLSYQFLSFLSAKNFYIFVYSLSPSLSPCFLNSLFKNTTQCESSYFTHASSQTPSVLFTASFSPFFLNLSLSLS